MRFKVTGSKLPGHFLTSCVARVKRYPTLLSINSNHTKEALSAYRQIRP